MGKTKANSKYSTADGFTYLTKRTVVSKAKAAGRKAAKGAMVTMGYVVTAQNGQIVKKYADGRIEVMTQLKQVPIPQDLKLG